MGATLQNRTSTKRRIDMNLQEIKEKMIAYKDFFGGDILEIDLVESAKSKTELKSIIANHRTHLEMQANDAQDDLDRFQNSIGLGFNDIHHCPECLEEKDEEELDMFGGLCEECSSY